MAADERGAIEAVIRDYLDGMIYGQFEKIESAFHPQSMVAGHFDGTYYFVTRQQFIDILKTDTPLKPGTPYNSSIESVDITGDAASAKVIDDCLGTTFTDYLTLIKDGGRWQIVNKAFYDHASG